MQNADAVATIGRTGFDEEAMLRVYAAGFPQKPLGFSEQPLGMLTVQGDRKQSASQTEAYARITILQNGLLTDATRFEAHISMPNCQYLYNS